MSELESILGEWRFVRKLTTDLLLCFDAKQLSWHDSEKGLSELWKQFRHIARVQDDYTKALQTRTVKFETTNHCYVGGASKEELLKYLSCSDERFTEEVKKFGVLGPEATVDWFGESADLPMHIFRLISHETLHHGQLIIYARALDVDFPESWQAWGL